MAIDIGYQRRFSVRRKKSNMTYIENNKEQIQRCHNLWIAVIHQAYLDIQSKIFEDNRNKITELFCAKYNHSCINYCEPMRYFLGINAAKKSLDNRLNEDCSRIGLETEWVRYLYLSRIAEQALCKKYTTKIERKKNETTNSY